MQYFILALLIVALDRGVKFWIAAQFQIGETMQVIPGVIHLTRVENTGIAFGLLPNMRWILVGVVSVCVILLIVLLIRNRFNAFGRVSLAMILGGAIGNLIDRIWTGNVLDMFEVEFVRFAVFNVADCFVVVGGVFFVIYYIVHSVRTDKAASARRAASGASTVSMLSDEAEKDGTWTETMILEEYDLDRKMSGEHDDTDSR